MRHWLSILVAISFVSACGKNTTGFAVFNPTGPGVPPGNPGSPSAGGFFTDLRVPADQVFLIVSESGRLVSVRQDSVSGRLLSIGAGRIADVDDAANVSTTVTAMATFDRFPPAGDKRADCELTGMLTQRRSLAMVSISCIDQDDETTTSMRELGYDASVYESGTDLEDLDNANLQSEASGEIMALSRISSGSVSIDHESASTGCKITGRISQPGADFNAFDFAFTYADCIDELAVRNGRTSTGIAFVTPRRVAGFAGERLVLVEWFVDRAGNLDALETETFRIL